MRISKDVKPLGRKLFVRLRSEKERGGLLIPQTGKEWKQPVIEAEVLSVGPEVREVEVGDVALIQGHAGKWMDGSMMTDDPDLTHRIIDEDDVHAIIGQFCIFCAKRSDVFEGNSTEDFNEFLRKVFCYDCRKYTVTIPEANAAVGVV